MKFLMDILKYSFFTIPFALSILLLGGAYSLYDFNRIIIVSTASLFIMFAAYILIAGKKLFLSPIIYPLSLLLLYSLIQLIPLPYSILEILSPKSVYFMGIDNISAHPLSLAIPDTKYSILRIITLILFSVIVQRFMECDGKKWKVRIINLVIFSGVSLILTGFIFKLLGVQEWLNSTLYHDTIFYSIIKNPNHLAGFLGISTLLSISVAIDEPSRSKKAFFLSIFSVNFIGTILTLSKGGVLSLVGALLFLFFFRFINKKHKSVILPFIFAAIALHKPLYNN